MDILNWFLNLLWISMQALIDGFVSLVYGGLGTAFCLCLFLASAGCATRSIEAFDAQGNIILSAKDKVLFSDAEADAAADIEIDDRGVVKASVGGSSSQTATGVATTGITTLGQFFASVAGSINFNEAWQAFLEMQIRKLPAENFVPQP